MLALCGAVCGCEAHTPVARAPARTVDYAREIQALLDKRCVRCHRSSAEVHGYLNLEADSSYHQLVTRMSRQRPELPLVEPYAPEERPANRRKAHAPAGPAPGRRGDRAGADVDSRRGLPAVITSTEERMRRIGLAVPAVLLFTLSGAALAASTTALDNGDFRTVIDATAGGAFSTEPHDFTYFSFDTREVVPLTDAEAAGSEAWHIAFKRSEIRLNGGISGPGEVVGVDLHGAEDVIAEESFGAVTAADVPAADAFIADGPAYAISEWYAYDSSSHTMTVPGNAYELSTAEGRFAKFVVDGMEGASRNDAGRISFRWVVGEGTDLGGDVRSATVEVSGGREVYFSLTSGEAVTPSDPAGSMDWDLHFSGYVIRVNGGISGPGQGGAFPAYQTGQAFDEIDKAMGFGYFADRAGSAFSTETGEWYSYDSTTHLLSTRNHVYVIDTGDGLYKMQLLNFYQEVEGAPVSGFITFRWRPLPAAGETAVRSASWGSIKAATR